MCMLAGATDIPDWHTRLTSKNVLRCSHRKPKAHRKSKGARFYASGFECGPACTCDLCLQCLVHVAAGLQLQLTLRRRSMKGGAEERKVSMWVGWEERRRKSGEEGPDLTQAQHERRARGEREE